MDQGCADGRIGWSWHCLHRRLPRRFAPAPSHGSESASPAPRWEGSRVVRQRETSSLSRELDLFQTSVGLCSAVGSFNVKRLQKEKVLIRLFQDHIPVVLYSPFCTLKCTYPGWRAAWKMEYPH